MMTVSRVLVLGLDGATLNLVGPWAKAGHLPNLRRLIEEGGHGTLRSTIPPKTGPAWSAFATGLGSGNTGIFEFYRRKPDSYELRTISSADLNAPTLWEVLSQAGKRCVVIAPPMSYPAIPINGAVVTGILTPSTELPGFTYPMDLFERHGLRRADYIVRVRMPKGKDVETQQRHIASLEEMVNGRLELARRLLTSETWDFAFVHFMATDSVQHAYWRLLDPESPFYSAEDADQLGNPILEVFQEVDAAVGELVALARGLDGGCAVVIMSDHGFGPSRHSIYINRWLKEQGYLVTKRISRLSPDLIRQAVQTRWPALGALGAWPLQVAVRLGLGAYRLMPGLLRHRASAATQRRIGRLGAMKFIDWSATRAYSMGNMGVIFLNVQGRQPEGVVEPGPEYEALRDEIASKLAALTDGTGQRLISHVFRREEIYSGECVDELPDLFVLTEEHICAFNPRFRSRDVVGLPSSPYRCGQHLLHGLVIVNGPLTQHGVRLNGAQIMDIMPTVLYMLGVPVPQGLDGRVLLEAFKPDVQEEHPIQYAEGSVRPASPAETGLTDAESEAVREHLRQLGYID